MERMTKKKLTINEKDKQSITLIPCPEYVLGGPNCSTCLSLDEIKITNGEITAVPTIRSLCLGIEAGVTVGPTQVLIKKDNPFIKCVPVTNNPTDTPNSPSKPPAEKSDTNTFSTPLLIGIVAGGAIILGAMIFGAYKFYQYYQSQKTIAYTRELQSPSITPSLIGQEKKEDASPFNSYSDSDD